jgi:two-component system phosphate regulon sensor histidine kinase PhoR
MRSFFSQVLISNWLFLVVLLITGTLLFFGMNYVPAELRFLLFIMYIIFSMFLAFHTSFKIATNVTEKLYVIEKKTMEINAGDFGNQLPILEPKELSDLADSINSMSKRLQIQFSDLNFEKEKFDFLLQNLKEGVFAISSEGKILFINKSIPKTLIKENSQSLPIQDAIRHPKLLGFIEEHIFRAEDGRLNIETSKRHYRVKFYALKSNSSIIMYIGVINDKTEEREIQIFREQFVQSASHELKTPITSIKGYAETLLNKLNPHSESFEKRFMDAIIRNSDRMIRIVDDMLTISKIESYHSIFQIEKISLDEFLSQLKLSVEGIIKLKNQTFEIHLQDKICLEADMVLMEHMLLNLIQNASNYSKEGSRIELSVLKNELEVIFEIKDQGIGIPESHQKRIFERFYRVDADRSRKSGGTGLGLSIVKNIVELHSGYIQLESVENQGSKFTVHIPHSEKKLLTNSIKKA